MINIGPWWLYDIIAIAIIVGCVVFGMKRGFFISFYLLIIQVIALLILMFIPALLTNSLTPLLFGFLYNSYILPLVKEFKTIINDIIFSLFPDGTKIDFNMDNLNYELFKNAFAFFLYLFLSVTIYLLINIIGLIFYKVFKNKFLKRKILRSINFLLGAWNGLAIGTAISVGFCFVPSLPIVQTETQKIGITDWEDMNYEKIDELFKKGNSYKKYALSKKITSPLPMITLFGFTYSNACVEKYILDPSIVIANQLLAKKDIKDLSHFFSYYENRIIEGYASKNPIDRPLAICIDSMPQDNKAALRLMSEFLLMASDIFNEKNNHFRSTITSVDLINAFDDYYINVIGKNNQIEKINNKNGWITEKVLEDFYDYCNKTKKTNPFIVLAENINEHQKDNPNKSSLIKVLKSGKSTYNFLRNINYVNATSRNNLDTLPFLSSIYSHQYLINGMEITPSGAFRFGVFKGIDPLDQNVRSEDLLLNDVKNIKFNNKWWKQNYKNSYWIKYYFDFAKGYFN